MLSVDTAKKTDMLGFLVFLRATLVATLILTIATVSADTTEKKYPTLPYTSAFGGAFELIDHTGKLVTNKDFYGKYVILYFGFTNCADICPIALQSISMSLKELGPISENIIPILINLDIKQDSLKELEQYVHYFHPRFIGLTGTEQQVASAAAAYGIRYRYVEDDEGGTVMIHSGKIFFLSPDGKVLTHFPHEASVDWMATIIGRYVRESLVKGNDRAPN